MNRWVPSLFALFLLGGCASAPTLSPAPETKLADGGPGATDTAASVRVVATLDAWRWRPDELDEFVTPVLLEVENNGDVPIRIRLRDIRLVGDRGTRLAALPPYRVRGRATRTVKTHEYAYDEFSVAPHLHDHYPMYPRSRYHYYHDYYYYRTYYPVYRTYSIELPTQEMLSRASTEGTVAPGGKAMGFVYFERVNRKVAKKTAYLDLLVQVTNAEIQAALGAAKMRFDLD